MRQIEIDVETAQGVGAEDTVERTGEHARHIERRDADAAPRYRRLAGSEAAQFDLIGRQVAGKAAYLPLKFDLRGLRADALGSHLATHEVEFRSFTAGRSEEHTSD